MSSILLSFLSALSICLALVPMWIKVCSKRSLFETPGDRKHHVSRIPSMGGMAIFAATTISFLLFADSINHPETKFLAAASIALFFTGFFDDMLDISALKKLLVQIAIALMVVLNGIKINSLQTILGTDALSVPLTVAVSVFAILFITNAYNFIDGLDGLASFIGLLITSVFGVLFIMQKELTYATLCFSVAGALIAFLYYNFEPAKVFMGDSGSLVIGFLISVLTIQLFNSTNSPAAFDLNITPNIIIATLFILIFDLSRVTFIRIANGGSPFKADRSHIHHTISREQFGHRGTTLIMVMFNILFIAIALLLPALHPIIFLIICYSIAIFLINSKIAAMLSVIRTKLIGPPVKKLEVN